jgi:RimJ/RimL family protein N-acetyltransferase
MNALGDLVRLRAMEPSDAEALWRWNHDPEVMRWMDAGYAQSLAQVQKWLTDRPRNDYGDVLFGIEELGDSTLIGLVRLHGAEPGPGSRIWTSTSASGSTGARGSPPTPYGPRAGTASTTCGFTRSR